MDILEDIIKIINSNDYKYSVSYWTIGNKDKLQNYIETEYCYGSIYNDKNISITRWAIENSDLEEWLVIGLTEEEIDYIREKIKEAK